MSGMLKLHYNTQGRVAAVRFFHDTLCTEVRLGIRDLCVKSAIAEVIKVLIWQNRGTLYTQQSTLHRTTPKFT